MEKLINSAEKIFRYVLPGAFTYIILFCSKPEIFKTIFKCYLEYKITYIGSLIIIIITGMIIYGIHRLLYFVIIEPILYLFNQTAVSNFYEPKNFKLINLFKKLYYYPKYLSNFIEKRQKAEEKLSNYLYYKHGTTRFVLLISELMIISLFIKNDGSLIQRNWTLYLVITIVLFVSSFIAALMLYRVEKEMFKNEPETP